MPTIGFSTKESSMPKATVALDDFKHALFIGRTGSGKTTGGITPLIDSRIKAGYGILIFDEKGKEHQTVKLLAKRYGRLTDVVEIGKPHGIRINILHEMSERQMEQMIRNVIKGDDNWMEGAMNMFMDLSRWLTGIKDFYILSIDAFECDPYAIRVKCANEIVEDKVIEINHEISNEPLTLSELSHYFKNTIDFTIITQLSTHYIELISNKIMEKLDEDSIREETFSEYLYQADAMSENLNKISTSIMSYRIKTNNSEASGNNGTYFMVGSTIGMLGSDRYINDPAGSDIAELLNAGRIVIVNTESFTNTVLSNVLNKTLSSLLLRAKLGAKIPISIVIDEANRVLSADSDLYIDILRTSRVEAVVAIQNHHLMRVKMGVEKWESLVDNFNTRYLFLGSDPHKTGIFRVQNEHNDQFLEADAMYLDEEELNNAEHAYQRIHGFYEFYKTSKDEIAIYDHLLFEKKKSILMHNTLSDQMREVPVKFKTEEITSTLFRSYGMKIKTETHSVVK